MRAGAIVRAARIWYHEGAMADKLQEHLNSLARDACYRVCSTLKESEFETTDVVCFSAGNGAELGPFVRKRIKRFAGLGNAYGRVFEAQARGRRFLYLPRIIDCYNAGECLVVIMEYVEGATLEETVRLQGPSVAAARKWFAPACDAVTSLHETFDPPIIHRDLKPSNIIVSPEGLTLIDLGIARSYNEGVDADTRHFGTRSYAPPEQFGFAQTDERSDVYALGNVLAFLLTGRSAGERRDECESGGQDVPPSLSRVVSQATSLDPDQRFQSVQDLKAAFLEAVGVPGALEQATLRAFAPVIEPLERWASAAEDDLWQGGVELHQLARRALDTPGRVRTASLVAGAVWDVVLAASTLIWSKALALRCFDAAGKFVLEGFDFPSRCALFGMCALIPVALLAGTADVRLVTERLRPPRRYRLKWRLVCALAVVAVQAVCFAALLWFRL